MKTGSLFTICFYRTERIDFASRSSGIEIAFSTLGSEGEELNSTALHRDSVVDGERWRKLFVHRGERAACCLIYHETLFVETKRHPLKNVESAFAEDFM